MSIELGRLSSTQGMSTWRAGAVGVHLPFWGLAQAHGSVVQLFIQQMLMEGQLQTRHQERQRGGCGSACSLLFSGS